MNEKNEFKKVNEELENIEVNECDVNEDEPQVTLKEVYRKGDLILYEYEDDDVGYAVSEDVINELFPNFEVEPLKYYIIEKNGEFLYD